MAAPKENKYGLANFNSGRPAFYEKPEEMEKKAKEYFDLCTTPTGICKPGIDGLTFHLGYASRQSLNDQRKRGQAFSDMIDRFKMFIRSCYEYNLHGYNWAGSAFALRNIGSEDWKEETHQNITQTVTEVKPEIMTTPTPLASSEQEIKE